MIGAALPFYIMYGGFLDGFISGYHEAFGFPNAPRRNTPNDQFRYRYAIDDKTLVQREDNAQAFGDLTIRVKTNLAMLVQYQQLEPFIQSSLPVLDQSAIQLALGLRWRRSDRYLFEWRFAEDITRGAPDFTLGFNVVIRWIGATKSTDIEKGGRQ